MKTREEAPQREFSFERTGNLLKSDVAPLDPDLWYIVFEENGEKGHVAPLYFDDTSMCKAADGSEVVCNPDQFTNAADAVVKGEMSEAGVQVKLVELLNN